MKAFGFSQPEPEHDEGHHFCVSLLCAHGQAIVVQEGFRWSPDFTWTPVSFAEVQARNVCEASIFRPPIVLS